MNLSVHWLSQAGSITTDNRDIFAYVEHAHASLYLIADGSSRHPLSGELANALLGKLLQVFSELQAFEANPEKLAHAMARSITRYRESLHHVYPRAACSYLLLCVLANTAFSIHEGDCCLGCVESDGQIRWLSTVHCAANWQGNLSHAEIAKLPSRHTLSRCFSVRRQSNPEITHWSFSSTQHWLLASDGFWAGLDPSQQQTFLRDGHLSTFATDDDISCLRLSEVTTCPAI